MFNQLELIDRQLFLMLNGLHTSEFDNVMYYISQTWVFTPLFLYWIYLIFLNMGIKKTSILLIGVALLVVFTDQTSNQIKHATKRYRPTHNIEIGSKVHIVREYRGGKYGFFSGHATNSFGIAMLLCLIFNKKSLIFRASFFIWAFLTGYSRIYLGVHYPSDVFVGMLVGLVWGFIVYQLLQYIFNKKFNEAVSI